MNEEITAFQKRFSLENYCKTDDEFWATIKNRVIDLPGEEWRTIPGRYVTFCSWMGIFIGYLFSWNERSICWQIRRARYT